MPIRVPKWLVLTALLLLAIALAGWLPGDAVARVMFQSSPADVPFEETPTLISTDLPVETPVPFSTTPVVSSPETIPTTEPPVATVFPASRDSVAEEPAVLPSTAAAEALAVPGYLPPPTLTAPGAFAYGQGLPQLTGPRTSSGATGAPADPAPQAAPVAESQAAQLIDNLLSLLSYGWLCCGSVLIVLAAVGLVWLARRKPAG